jgi:hypothetical protein
MFLPKSRAGGEETLVGRPDDSGFQALHYAQGPLAAVSVSLR